MKLILTALLVALGVSMVSATEAPRDMVVLTVSGMIGKTNRGALDERRDGLLARYGAKFERAFAFDRAMLLRLSREASRCSRLSSTSPRPSPARS